MKVSGVSKFFRSLAASQPTTALGARPKQAATSMDSSTLAREQTLVQDANRREQEAARRDELAHFEKQKCER